MNDRLAKRPRFRDLPIPYVQFIRSDGIPDFKIVDEEKRWECVNNRLCGLCGDPLDYYIAFIGGPLCVENRAYVEPPMHLECIHDAMKLCPYLFKGKEHADHFKQDPGISGDKTVYTEDFISDKRPDRMGILVAKNYKVKIKRRSKVIEPGNPVRIEWYDEQGDRIDEGE